jgi:hypothetical protein
MAKRLDGIQSANEWKLSVVDWVILQLGCKRIYNVCLNMGTRCVMSNAASGLGYLPTCLFFLLP